MINAPFLTRLAAQLVDTALVGSITAPFYFVADQMPLESLAVAFLVVFIFGVLSTIYHWLAEASGAQATPGKRLFGLVVCAQAGRRMSRGRAFVRLWPYWVLPVSFVSVLAPVLPLIGILLAVYAIASPLFNRERLAWQDRATGSRVVSVASERVAPVARRYAAALIDFGVIAAIVGVVVGGTFLVERAAGSSHFPAIVRDLAAAGPAGQAGFAMILVLVAHPVAIVYFLATESGPRASSWGQRLLGLRIVTPDGQPPTFRILFLRRWPLWVALWPFVSWLPFLIAVLAVPWFALGRSRLMLHDHLVGTRVMVRRSLAPAPTPDEVRS